MGLSPLAVPRKHTRGRAAPVSPRMKASGRGSKSSVRNVPPPMATICPLMAEQIDVSGSAVLAPDARVIRAGLVHCVPVAACGHVDPDLAPDHPAQVHDGLALAHRHAPAPDRDPRVLAVDGDG